jgi:hypothetical protein
MAKNVATSRNKNTDRKGKVMFREVWGGFFNGLGIIT